jgi:hypothetical protein
MRNLGILLAITMMTGALFAQPATTPRTAQYSFPLVGLANSESIQVNLINLAPNSNSGTASSCTGNVAFTTVGGGTSIGGGGTFTLAANEATSIGPSAGDNVIAAGARSLLHVVVTTNFTLSVPCNLSFSLNTFDTASGVTHVFLTGTGPAVIQPVLNPGR